MKGLTERETRKSFVVGCSWARLSTVLIVARAAMTASFAAHRMDLSIPSPGQNGKDDLEHLSGGLLHQPIQHLLCLLVQVWRRTVEHTGGLTRPIEQKHCGHGGDVPEGDSGRRVRNGPMQVLTQAGNTGTDLVLRRLHGQSDDRHVV